MSFCLFNEWGQQGNGEIIGNKKKYEKASSEVSVVTLAADNRGKIAMDEKRCATNPSMPAGPICSSSFNPLARKGEFTLGSRQSKLVVKSYFSPYVSTIGVFPSEWKLTHYSVQQPQRTRLLVGRGFLRLCPLPQFILLGRYIRWQ